MINREKLLLILTVFVGLFLGRSLAAQTAGTPSQIKGTGTPSSGLCIAGSVGQEYFQTDATAGQNVYKCTSAGVWTQASAATTEIQSGGISYCASATTNDSYACNFAPAFTAYDANGTCVTGEVCTGTVIQFYADVQNTGAATFAPNGLAAKAIRKGGKNAALTTGDIEAGQVVTLAYNRVADVWQYQSQLSTVVNPGIPTVESQTASSSASLNFTTCITSTYNTYMVVVKGMHPSNNLDTLYIKLSSDGGATWISGASYATNLRRWNAFGQAYDGSSSTAAWNLNTQQSNTSTTQGYSGVFYIFNPLSTTQSKSIVGHGTGYTTASEGFDVAGSYASTTAINAFQVIASTGNLLDGTVTCQGVIQ